MKTPIKNKFSSANSDTVLYGKHAVMAALRNKKRKIKRLICTPENAVQIREISSVSPQIAEKKDIERLVGADAVHQGIVAVVQPLEAITLDELCAQTADSSKALVVILDQVSDPQNIGAILRSAAAFNAKAVIVQDKNSPKESGSMAKAAAGTLELVPLIRTANLSRAIETLKKNGFWVIGMDGYATQTIDQLDKSGKKAVVMGSEGTGMRRLIEENCDLTVRLPINPDVESLNVSTAAAIVLYELSK